MINSKQVEKYINDLAFEISSLGRLVAWVPLELYGDDIVARYDVYDGLDALTPFKDLISKHDNNAFTDKASSEINTAYRAINKLLDHYRKTEELLNFKDLLNESRDNQ